MYAAPNRFHGATFTKRMKTTTEDIDRLNRVNAPYEQKAKVIRAAKLPKALYGCEVAPANELALQGLRTSITSAATYTTEQRSSDLTFATCSYGLDLDPDITIFARRAVAFRRFMARGGDEEEEDETSDEDEEETDEEDKQSGGRKSPANKEEAFNLNVKRVEAILARYKEAGDPGIYVDEEQVEENGGRRRPSDSRKSGGEAAM